MTYNLIVCGMFKNESHVLREWLEHYLYHGADHFFLINDNSDDQFMDILQPYIDKEQVTLFDSNNWGHYYGRQRDMHNHYFLPQLNKTKWLLIVDLDEFIWSQAHINLNVILDLCKNYSQIQIDQTLFGSNGHIKQPKSVVAGFTKKANHSISCSGNRKYFVNSAYQFSSLNVHHASYIEGEAEPSHFVLLGFPWFILNHYNCQSYDFWTQVKCMRGDNNEYKTRTPDDFKLIDLNDIEDTGLAEQNKILLS